MQTSTNQGKTSPNLESLKIMLRSLKRPHETSEELINRILLDDEILSKMVSITNVLNISIIKRYISKPEFINAI